MMGRDHSLTVAVHGLGYVGLVTAACLAHHGHRVIGIDVDGTKVDQIGGGRSPVVEPELDRLVAEAVGCGRLKALRPDPELLPRLVAEVDVHLISVGTPSSAGGAPDVEAVVGVVDDLTAAFAGDQAGRFPVIAVRSTVLPGTVDSLAERVSDRCGLVAGRHYGLAMCPEFLRETSAVADFFDPPFTVAGVSDDYTAAILAELFAFIAAPFHAVDLRTAETVKYACNAFHALKVTFANEIGRFAESCGADGRLVMDIFREDDRLNTSAAYLRPGFAFGGSCLPKDLRALLHRSRQVDLDLPLLGSVLASNERHLQHTIDLVLVHRPNRVALLGLTFKTGTDDLRESPYVRLAEALIGKGVEVAIWDPDLVPARLLGGNRRFIDDRLPHLAALLHPSAGDALAGADVCVLGSHHPAGRAAVEEAEPMVVVDTHGSVTTPARRAEDQVGAGR